MIYEHYIPSFFVNGSVFPSRSTVHCSWYKNESIMTDLNVLTHMLIETEASVMWYIYILKHQQAGCL